MFAFGKALAVTETTLVYSNVPETLPAWSAGTTYAANAQVRQAVGGIQRIFTSKAGGNLAHDPALDTTATYWTGEGPTNRYAMFDGSRGSRTVHPSEIVVIVRADGWVNTATVQNVDAAEIQLTQTDALEGLVYDETFDMVSDSGILDPFAYCFTPITRLSDLTLMELKPYSDSLIMARISNPGGNAACGEFGAGWLRDYGDTQWDGEIGVQDFSIVDFDEWGAPDVVERAYARRATPPVIIDTAMVDVVAHDLAELRATPSLFVFDDAYNALTIQGFPKDWSIRLGPVKSWLSIEVRGLT